MVSLVYFFPFLLLLGYATIASCFGCIPLISTPLLCQGLVLGLGSNSQTCLLIQLPRALTKDAIIIIGIIIS
jgi:hypothetical protein